MPETEIDFINLARTLWEGRKLLGKIMLIFVVAGMATALIIPGKYTASCTFATQTADAETSLTRLSSLKGLSGIATLAGANINLEIPESMELSPLTYIDIIRSEPFQRDLDQATQKEEPNGSKTIQAKKQIFLVYDDFKGLATLSCTTTDPKTAAQVCQSTLQIFQDHLTKIYTGKAATNISYIQERLNQAQKKVPYEIQNDAHKASVNTAREKDVEISVLAQLSKELEHAKIRLQEETPYFVVIKPTTVPIEKSSPNQLKILVYFAFAGFVLSFILIIGKTYMQDVRNKWQQSKTTIV